MALRGWVYIIRNNSMPGLVKVGHSTKDPVLRAEELSCTGTPLPYRVIYDALVRDPRAVEEKAHKKLGIKREGKEWFRCNPLEAVEAIKASADVIIAESSILPIQKSNASECACLGCSFQGKLLHLGRLYCQRHHYEVIFEDVT